MIVNRSFARSRALTLTIRQPMVFTHLVDIKTVRISVYINSTLLWLPVCVHLSFSFSFFLFLCFRVWVCMHVCLSRFRSFFSLAPRLFFCSSVCIFCRFIFLLSMLIVCTVNPLGLRGIRPRVYCIHSRTPCCWAQECSLRCDLVSVCVCSLCSRVHERVFVCRSCAVECGCLACERVCGI